MTFGGDTAVAECPLWHRMGKMAPSEGEIFLTIVHIFTVIHSR